MNLSQYVMEKHYPANGDLPPRSKESQFFSLDILVKTKSGIRFVGWLYFPDGTWTYTNGDFWNTEEIECWWYLPE